MLDFVLFQPHGQTRPAPDLPSETAEPPQFVIDTCKTLTSKTYNSRDSREIHSVYLVVLPCDKLFPPARESPTAFRADHQALSEHGWLGTCWNCLYPYFSCRANRSTCTALPMIGLALSRHVCASLGGEQQTIRPYIHVKVATKPRNRSQGDNIVFGERRTYHFFFSELDESGGRQHGEYQCCPS